VDEVGKIIAAAREPYKTMFWLLATTGMRAGEMLGLQWSDIDFEKGLLNIRRSAWYGHVQTSKNKNSEAIIPLPVPTKNSIGQRSVKLAVLHARHVPDQTSSGEPRSARN